MRKVIVKLQIGKNGLTEGFMGKLKTMFEKHKFVKISVIQHKDKTKDMAEQIVSKLGKNYVYRVVGFTISLRKLGIVR